MAEEMTPFDVVQLEINRVLEGLSEPRRGIAEEVGLTVRYIEDELGPDGIEQVCLSGVKVWAHIAQLRAMARDAVELRDIANLCRDLVDLQRSASGDAEAEEVDALVSTLIADAALVRSAGVEAVVRLPAPLDADQQAHDLVRGLTSAEPVGAAKMAVRYVALDVVLRRLGLRTNIVQRVAEAFAARYEVAEGK